MKNTTLALAWTVALVLMSVDSASGSVLAEQPRAQISGGKGLLVWSRFDADASEYRLVITRGGATTALPVPPSTMAFDVQVADERDSRTRLVYSRCDQARSRCSLRQHILGTRGERPLLVRAPRGVHSTYAPTVSQGAIAFAGVGADRRVRIYLQRSKDAKARPVPLARPGGDDPRSGTGGRGEAEGLTSIALRRGKLAYTWEYAGQRPRCSGDTKVGQVPNSMLVVTGGSTPGRVVAHGNCNSDGTTVSVFGANWVDDDSVRYLANLAGSPRITAVRETRLGSGRITEWVPGRDLGFFRDISSYATDGRRRALGQVAGKVRTLPIVP